VIITARPGQTIGSTFDELTALTAG
jgi:hypothetical protein